MNSRYELLRGKYQPRTQEWKENLPLYTYLTSLEISCVDTVKLGEKSKLEI